MTTGTPSSRKRIVVALQKYYEGLYRDLRDRYLRVKNSNKNISENGVFLAVFPISGDFSECLVLPLTAYETTILTRELGVPVTADAFLEVTNR